MGIHQLHRNGQRGRPLCNLCIFQRLGFNRDRLQLGFTQSYFKYGSGTDHVFEATLAYTGGESLPLSASLNTMFAGADKTSAGKQAYSTYLELGYQLTSNGKVIVGGLLTDAPAYKSGAGVTNVGFKATKSIEITDKFSLPVYGVVGVNPLAKDAFLVVGITL